MNLLAIVATLALIALPHLGQAAEIRTQTGSGYTDFVLEGVIEPGDTERLVELVRETPEALSNLWLFSPGGDYEESMRLGRTLRALEFSTMVPSRVDEAPSCTVSLSGRQPIDPANCTCASACFFAHIGSLHRGGTYLAVHRPYFAKGKFGQLSEQEATAKFNALQSSARTYMADMGVPAHVAEDILGTPSDRVMLLDDRTVKTYFWKYLPARHEWLQNRCSDLSPEERARYDRYGAMVLANGGRRRFAEFMTPAEVEDHARLFQREGAALTCVVDVTAKSRREAQRKYFQSNPPQ
ncbi:hypothetical protein N800_06745 [Lysobacter daejeonensis GH1-9]|uniref:Uncharacterized protein n=1 Tax=Lysobacter daejeonensis GH1-9 TaxID=1385517 RepID=A0A0A0EUP6_9GAMM|nr:hypothetical protein [Lysobacter daejeonensis]KGM54671.1 hypothetical protein N800_06745 [Lysobacter daejeonensis GH1-9]